MIHLPENIGIAGARNVGLEHAGGEYLAFIDSDDWIAPSMYMDMTNELKNQAFDTVIGGYQKSTQTGNFLEKEESIALKANTPLQTIEFLSEHHFLFHNLWNKIYKREIISQHQIRFKLQCGYFDDLIFTSQFFMHVNSFSVLPECYYHWVMHGKNTSRIKPASNDQLWGIYFYIRLLSHLNKKREQTHCPQTSTFIGYFASVYFSVYLIAIGYKISNHRLKDLMVFVRLIQSSPWHKISYKNPKEVIIGNLIKIGNPFLIVLTLNVFSIFYYLIYILPKLLKIKK